MAIPTFQEVIEDLESKRVVNHASFAPSDEPLTWDQSGLVRLDVAIYAVHLYCARLTFRSFAHQANERVKTAVVALAEFVGRKLVLKAASGLVTAVKILLSVLTLVIESWRVDLGNKEVEKAIRRQSLITMREVLRLKLKPGTRKRRTDYVLSRHETPRQRMPNKKWKQRRAQRRQ